MAVMTNDQRIKAFLELVRCRPDEVRDVPADRLNVPPQLVSYGKQDVIEARRAALGEKPVYFGMHKGRKLKDVPRDYLRWALDQNPTAKWFRKFQRHVRAYVGDAD